MEYIISAEILFKEYNSRNHKGAFDVKTVIANPIVVLYALSIELNLKAVLLAENADIKYQKYHDLKKLFKAIKMQEYVDYVKNDFEERYFDRMLEKFSDAFISIRYIWENLNENGIVNVSTKTDIDFMNKFARKVAEGFLIIRKNYNDL
jgi:HEPN domain-containing protein